MITLTKFCDHFFFFSIVRRKLQSLPVWLFEKNSRAHGKASCTWQQKILVCQFVFHSGKRTFPNCSFLFHRWHRLGLSVKGNTLTVIHDCRQTKEPITIGRTMYPSPLAFEKKGAILVGSELFEDDIYTVSTLLYFCCSRFFFFTYIALLFMWIPVKGLSGRKCHCILYCVEANFFLFFLVCFLSWGTLRTFHWL